MTEVLTPFTNPQVVLDRLGPLNEVLIPALDYSCEMAAQYFKRNKLSFDAGLHSHLTRHRLLNILATKSIRAYVEENVFAAESEPLCGVRIESQQCLVKLLKNPSPKQEIPAGVTQPRRDFYQSNLELSFDDNPDEQASPRLLHLLALWNADDQHRLSSLSYACPYGRDERRPKWWQGVNLAAYSLGVEMEAPEAEEPELEEITPRLAVVEDSPQDIEIVQDRDRKIIQVRGSDEKIAKR